MLLALAAAFSILASGQQPAQAALLPGLARNPRELVIANSLRQGFGNAGYCAGALAGGAAAASLSVAAGFAVALAASAAALLALGQMTADPRPAHRAARSGASVAGELLLGAHEVRATPALRDAAALLAAIAFVYGILDVLIVVVAIELVDLGASGVGVLNSAWGAGGLIGGFAALALLARGRFSTAMDAGAACIAVPLAVLAAAADPTVAIAAFAVLGVGWAVAETAGQTLLQRLASDESLARVFGVAEAGSQVAVALGSVAAPLLDRRRWASAARCWPPRSSCRCSSSRAGARRSAWTREAVVPERELQALRAVDLFAPLPLATVETLALRALPRVVYAGEQILRVGDIDTRFYVIADGTLAAHAGPIVRRLGPGDYFGEIALLRDVPRTASVLAETDGLLYVIARRAVPAGGDRPGARGAGGRGGGRRAAARVDRDLTDRSTAQRRAAPSARASSSSSRYGATRSP